MFEKANFFGGSTEPQQNNSNNGVNPYGTS